MFGNKWALFGVVLLMSFGFVFAEPLVYWAEPTPWNGEYVYSDVVIFNMTTNETFGPNTIIDFNGANKTCTMSLDNTSCYYTMNYSDKVLGDTYNITGYGNFTEGYTTSNESRLIYYVGCGYVDRNMSLYYDIGSPTYAGDCIMMNASNITFDLNGHSITTNSTSNAIYAATLNNLVIENGLILGGAIGVRIDDVNTSVIRNLSIRDTEIAGITLDYANLNNITMNTLQNVTGYGIMLTVDSNLNNVSYNSLDDGDVGLYVTSGNHNQLLRNNVTDHSSYAVLITDDLTEVEYNRMQNNVYGMALVRANDTVNYRNHFCNNDVDYEYYAVDATEQMNNLILYDTFEGSACDYAHGASIAIMDVVFPNETYWINASTMPTSLPSGRYGLMNKVIWMSNRTAVPTVFDNIIFIWNASESSAYNESTFELWSSTTGGVFTLQNATLNTTSNTLEMDYLNITVPGGYKFMILRQNAAGGTTVGDDAAARTIAAFVPIAIAFFVLFTIIGSFGVMKGMNLEEFFVPIMAVALIAILVWGLFMQ